MCIDEPAFSCGEEQSLIHWDKTVPPERAGLVEPGSQPQSGFPLLVTRWRLELQKFLSLTQRECLYPSSSNRSPGEASHWPFVGDGHIPEPITAAGGTQHSDWPGPGLAPPVDSEVGSTVSPKGNLGSIPRGEGMDTEQTERHWPLPLGLQMDWAARLRYGQQDAEEQPRPVALGAKTTSSHRTLS